MERAMSVEERIRRAEDIYNRRNGGISRVATKPEKEVKLKKRKVKKLLMQIFVCLTIYVIFYFVINREYVFSEEFRNEVSSFFTEKTKLAEWYSNVKGFISSKFNGASQEENKEGANTGNAVTDGNNESQNTNSQGKADETQNAVVENSEGKKDENIGGATDSVAEQTKEEKKDEELSEQELMEKQAKEIKEKISFILPITGRISSTFGWRNPTTANVPKYHTGIDIAANEGTVIKSATDGKVIMASSQGDFGNHYQIRIDDVVIVYAHCKKLYLKEGDTVKKGQKIAEVGSTGNSTGPHLHFEIRKGDKKIDPQLVLDF